MLRAAVIAVMLSILCSSGVSAKQSVSTDLSTVLRNIPKRIPELVFVPGRQVGSSSVAYYVLANEQGATSTANALSITLDSYDSPEAAERGRELSLHMTSVAPDRLETYKGLTLYRWGPKDGRARILCRVGTYVINVSILRQAAEPFIMKALDSVVEETLRIIR